ncbi:TPA: hypothetical protein SA969_000223 [Campylobacter jejuni]|nr:hypothetical protein [Campylobacter jejuni]
MNNLENNTNVILFAGSAILAFFYQFLAYFKIETAQVIVLLIVFSFSGIASIVGGKIKCRKRKIKCRIFATNYLSFNLKLKL